MSMTELTTAARLLRGELRRPEVIAAIREDEAKFLQSDRTRMIGVVQYDAG